MEDIEKIIYPYIPLRGVNILPKTTLHFEVGRDKSKEALKKAMEEDQLLFVSTQKDESNMIVTFDDVYRLGTLVKIKQMLKVGNGNLHVIAEGLSRAYIDEAYDNNSMFSCSITPSPVHIGDLEEPRKEAILRILSEKGVNYIAELHGDIPPNFSFLFEETDEVETINKLIMSMKISAIKKQNLYEIGDLMARAEELLAVLLREIDVLHEEKKIEENLKNALDKSQREYVLKEKIKVIQDELGEVSQLQEAENWKKELKKLNLEEKIEEKIIKEIDRYGRLQSVSPDSSVIRSYIETILDLPWNNSSDVISDINISREILDKDHYGLEKVKERILEYLAVIKLTEKIKGPIICLVGPPGVGKTSIAKSIAEATNREFVRMSLGGVRDEAEIRGHRRTYVGAIPGNIISNIKTIGVNNPVFLLDEIDKLGSDYRGDPASALLEVLDPEQNNAFVDHYLDIPFDLSKVLFVTTANSTGTIPRPLLDRMEIIELSGYTEEEKCKIAEKYLVPREIKENGLENQYIKITNSALKDIISCYTRESGVRNLQRQIGNIMRKIAVESVTKNKNKFEIKSKNLEKILGKKKFNFDKIEKEELVGIVNGMAWTQVGGTLLKIETILLDGNGKLQLTGKLGDVMQESAKAALSYIRSIYKELGIEEDFYKKYDIHIHVPEGAVPKDGPSAGVTMFVALVSALTKKPVSQNVAMTGEITLRGKILPVGGIKEKVLAAYRSGARTILFPKDNMVDTEEIPANVRKNIEFVPLDYALDALPKAITTFNNVDTDKNFKKFKEEGVKSENN